MIERHKISRDIQAELNFAEIKYEKFKLKVKQKLLENSKVNLNAYSKLCLRVPTYALVLKQEDNVIKGIYSYLESGIAHFKLSFNTSDKTSIKIDNEIFEIATISQKSNVGLFEWWKLLNIAIILKDNNFQDELFSFHPKSTEEDNDPFWNRFTQFILMCLGQKTFENSILEDLKSIVNSGVVSFIGISEKALVKSDEGKRLRELLWLPLAEIYYYSMKSESKKVNEKIESLLISKKEWIIQNKEQDNSSLWIDFSLTAACGFAKEKGILIDIKSDYIPEFLIA